MATTGPASVGGVCSSQPARTLAIASARRTGGTSSRTPESLRCCTFWTRDIGWRVHRHRAYAMSKHLSRARCLDCHRCSRRRGLAVLGRVVSSASPMHLAPIRDDQRTPRQPMRAPSVEWDHRRSSDHQVGAWRGRTGVGLRRVAPVAKARAGVAPVVGKGRRPAASGEMSQSPVLRQARTSGHAATAGPGLAVSVEAVDGQVKHTDAAGSSDARSGRRPAFRSVRDLSPVVSLRVSAMTHVGVHGIHRLSGAAFK
jgi:hypothetical protein